MGIIAVRSAIILGCLGNCIQFVFSNDIYNNSTTFYFTQSTKLKQYKAQWREPFKDQFNHDND